MLDLRRKYVLLFAYKYVKVGALLGREKRNVVNLDFKTGRFDDLDLDIHI